MLTFWILCALAASIAALLIMSFAKRGVDVAVGSPQAAGETARRELSALDRLRDEGLLGETEWAEARAEAARRWLELSPADAPAEAVEAVPARPGRHDRLGVMLSVAATVTATMGLYFWIADPGLPDQPHAVRVEAWSQSTEPLEAVQVAAVLEREVRDRPQDQRMWTLLGSARFQSGDSVGAASAFRRAVLLNPTDAQSWARLGESLVRSQEGEVGLDAESAFREALKLDPGQLGALFFLGDAALKRGEIDTARSLWTPLMQALEPSDPRRIDLERRLAAAGSARGAAG